MQDVNPTEVASIINNLKDTIIWLLSILSLLGLFFYAKNRAGSTHFIHDMIWRILGGKKTYDNPNLQGESIRLSDYEKFNYNTGIRFPSYKSITKTLEWLHSNGIGLEEIIRIRFYFDSREITIRKPRIKLIKTVYRSSIITFFLAIAILLLSGFPAALLSIKKTGTVILAYENHVTSWNPFSWSITNSDCNKKITEISEHDKQVICEILSDEKRHEYLEKTILTQRVAAILLVLLAGLYLALTTRTFVEADEAIKLRIKSTREPNQGGSQSPDELPTQSV